jgi:hypothetical protein
MTYFEEIRKVNRCYPLGHSAHLVGGGEGG